MLGTPLPPLPLEFNLNLVILVKTAFSPIFCLFCYCVQTWTYLSEARIKASFGQAERDFFNEQLTANKGNSGCIQKTTQRAIPTNPTQFHQYTKDTSTLANEFNRFFFFFAFVFFFLISFGENVAKKKLKDLQDHMAWISAPS